MARKPHPFRDTPQWKQQYGGGLGYYGNGLGDISGLRPEWGEGDFEYERTRRPGTQYPTRSDNKQETKTVSDVLAQAGLTEKQRFVMELRHGIRGGVPLTHREIASLMGVTHRAVQDLEKAAKRRLAKTLAIEA